MRRLGLALATVGGAGFFPFAPGTIGSAVGVVVYLLTRSWPTSWQLGLLAAVIVAGTWAANEAAIHFSTEDPGAVVIDEVAGQLLTCFALGPGLWGIAAGFVLFRIFDIVKPWPAGRFERLPGGIGIMADDLMAGLYANLVLRLLHAARLVV